MLLSAIFPLKLHIVLLDPFSGVSYICVVYVNNYCHRMNQNHRLKMGQTSHLSDGYDAFYSSCASFSLLSSLMMMTLTDQMKMVQGPGSLLVRSFCYVLNYPLIDSFDFRIAESFLVESQYSRYFSSTFPLKYFSSFIF